MHFFISSLIIFIVAYLSLIAHEAGHFVAAWAAGIPVRTIVFGAGHHVTTFEFFNITWQCRLWPVKGRIHLGIKSREFVQYSIGKKVFFYSGGIIVNFLIVLICLVFEAQLMCNGKDGLIDFLPAWDQAMDFCLLVRTILFVNLNTALALAFFPYVHFDGGRILFLLIDNYLPRYIGHFLYISMIFCVILPLLVIFALVKG